MPMFKKGRERMMSTVSIAANKGLLNEPGENNCFLNSAIQVLWHLDVFRRSFRLLNGHACMGPSCIFCALKDIFQQFQHSKAQALPPNVLRSALAETFQQQNRFQLGLMDDAAEVFENILLRLHVHIGNTVREDVCTAAHCIPHQKFGLSLVEQCVCSCGATSEPLPFIEMVHYVSATALCAEDEYTKHRYGTSVSNQMFGRLVRVAGGYGEKRSCPSECGAKVDMRKVLMNCPDVVSLGIVWDSEEPQVQNIIDLVHALGTTLRLADLFHTVVDERASQMELYLVGMVCYYGKHYSTFFFHTKLRKWVYFDDAQVSEVGKRWINVVEKCIKGHHQPLLLMYANPNATSISNATAPQTVTMLPGYMDQLNGGYGYSRTTSPGKGFRSELDSLSSEGDSTSFAEEENSGTESMLAANIPPSSGKTKSKSPSNPINHKTAPSYTTEKQTSKTSKTSKQDGKATSTGKPPKHQPTHTTVTQPAVKLLPVTLPAPMQPEAVVKAPRPAPAPAPVELKPTEPVAPRKPTFQWKMASEKTQSSNVKVGQYVEPNPAQWTKYKPYPQGKTVYVQKPKIEVNLPIAQHPSPQPSHTDMSVMSVESQGMASFALTSSRQPSEASSSTSTTPHQTPPMQHTRQMSGAYDKPERQSPVSKLRRTSQTSGSSIGTVSLASSKPESLHSRQAAPSPAPSNATRTDHTVVNKPDLPPTPPVGTKQATPTICNGVLHELNQTATNRAGSKPKPPLPPKPPFLSQPLTHNATQGHSPNKPYPQNVQQLSHLIASQIKFMRGTAAPPREQRCSESVSTSICAEKAELLFRDAEDRIEQSRIADTRMDYSSALQLCLEATKMLETVLMMQDVPSECMVKARIKHGECVNKARILQRRKNMRMKARDEEAGGNRSSMTEADRHMTQATNNNASTAPDVFESKNELVKEMEVKDENNLINFDKAGVTNLQHHVNQIYENGNNLRQHPNFRPPIGRVAKQPPRPASNANNNNSSNIGDLISPASSSSSPPGENADSSLERTKIFVWKRPEDEEEAIEMKGRATPPSRLTPNKSASEVRSGPVDSNPRRMVSESNLRSHADAGRKAKAPNVDREIAENMKSLTLNPGNRFRSRTPTPQVETERPSLSQHRRAKTPTPQSNKERMRQANRFPADAHRQRPKSAYGGGPLDAQKSDDSTDSAPVAPPRRRSNKSSSDTDSPTERPSSAMGVPFAYPGWNSPTPNPMMTMPFNPAMFSPTYYPYMYEWWQYYNSLTPEQKSMLGNMPMANQPPVFPVSSPMTAPPTMKAAYLENLKIQLGKNLRNFTNSIDKIPDQSRSNNANIYEANKPKPLMKSEPNTRSQREQPSNRSTRQPMRRAPVESRPNSKYAPQRRSPSSSDQMPNSSSNERRSERDDSRVQEQGRSTSSHPHPQHAPNTSEISKNQREGMMKWAEEAKKRAPGAGIPPEFRSKLIHDFANRSRRGEPPRGLPPVANGPSVTNGKLGSVASSSGGAPSAQTRGAPPNCNLCGLVKIPEGATYCSSCKAYLSRFKPTVNSLHNREKPTG